MILTQHPTSCSFNFAEAQRSWSLFQYLLVIFFVTSQRSIFGKLSANYFAPAFDQRTVRPNAYYFSFYAFRMFYSLYSKNPFIETLFHRTKEPELYYKYKLLQMPENLQDVYHTDAQIRSLGRRRLIDLA
jgi:hypothetical protein